MVSVITRSTSASLIWRAGAGFVQQPVQALGDESASPLAHGLLTQSQRSAHEGVAFSLRAGQDDAGSQRQGLRRFPRPRSALQGFLLFGSQAQFRYRAFSLHWIPPLL
jgi:hypothetical protein